MSFRHDIKVRWGDCDSAQIAYTGKIPDFALIAIEAWWEDTLSTDWYRLNIDKKLGAPFVHLSITFKHPITPRHVLECVVDLTAMGKSSISFEVDGYQSEILCFSGNFTQVFSSAEIVAKQSIPDEFRSILKSRLSSK